jgi:uncharacterized radical SAM protein YgiQ
MRPGRAGPYQTLYAMKHYPENSFFLPLSPHDMKRRGWAELDVLLITGDAYVDHPSYGVAVIGRLLESRGYRVGVVAQPDWRDIEDFTVLGKPRLFVGITSGNVDSMVANYTAAGKPRRRDSASPGDRGGLRPDRALIVYANRAREAFGRVPIVLGGLEASLRRLAHYDAWSDKVRRSILLDAKADILVYGMGETAVLEIAARLKREPAGALEAIRGTVVVRGAGELPAGALLLPAYEEVSDDPGRFVEAFRKTYAQMNPVTAQTLAQPHAGRLVIQYPPAFPLSGAELDGLHELPYARDAHPVYAEEGGVRAVETVRFSMISHRGCCGECSFCSLFMHQGRVVTSRSPDSLVREAEGLADRPDFRGTITDIGGPTANLYRAGCPRWERGGFCAERGCLTPETCSQLRLGYSEGLEAYRRIRSLPGVKHVFIASGFRHDLLVQDAARPYLEEVLRHHVSGRMKVAPEHADDSVLAVMNKPPLAVYERFLYVLGEINRRLENRRYLVNYFISAHPGAGLKEALNLALFLNRHRIRPEQVQDYIPLPMTVSGCITHTGIHPKSGEKVYVVRSDKERKLQRALLQPQIPANRPLVSQALRLLGASHLLERFYPRNR